MTELALHLTVGLPGSGKTTWAKAWVDAENAAGRPAARVNRDMIRLMLIDRLTGAPEPLVTAVAHAAVTALLQQGCTVVCDDTNLHSGHRAALIALAEQLGAVVVEHREFLDVPFEECVRRDIARGPLRVGISEIRRLAACLTGDDAGAAADAAAGTA